MASFTDQISKFNPYVQQLPIEAMVQVGMEKQKRYDEGLQKIQTNIDNIAGLDVIRDVDKLYLQSKLNQLGSNLKSIAAGDFSNFQLVNSVGGMASQIVRDPNVVNALSSTKAYRKGIEDMNALVKEGKGSASRTWEFKTKANEWLNSTELDSRFDASYKPYTNYRKNATEVIKALTGDSSIRDDAFDIDAKGNLVIKDAMTRRKLAGISPEKVQQALLVGLSPDDWEQMSVDGRYNYSNTDNQEFANSVSASYKSKYDAFAQQKTILENAKSSTPSAVEKTKIDQKIGELDKMLKNIQEEYNSVSKTFEEGDVESAKARLFTTNFMSGFSKAFSYTETSQTYLDSPFVQVQQWRENKAQEWKKFMMEYGQKERFHTDTMKKEDEKIRLQELALQGYNSFPTSVDDNDVPEVTLDKVVAQTNAIKSLADVQDAAFIMSQGKDKAWLDQQRIAWLKSPNGVDPLIAQHFNQTEGARKIATENQAMVNQINAEVDKKYGSVYKNIPKDAKNLTYSDGKGNTYVYTPRELVDFNAKVNSYLGQTTSKTRTSAAGPVYESVWLDSKAKEELSPKELVLYNAYTKGGKNMTSADGVLLNNLINYSKTVNIPYQKILQEKQQEVAKEVKRRLLGSQGKEYTIPTTTKAQQESLANIFTSVANLAESQKDKIAKSPNLNVETLRKIAQSGNPQGVIKVVEGTEFSPAMYEVTATGAAGTTKFRMTPEQKTAVFGDRFDPSPNVQAFRPFQITMQKFNSIDPLTGEPSKYLSTSPEKGPTNISNAALGPTNFSNVKSYGMSGNIVSGDGGVTYSLRLNIYDPKTGNLNEDIPYPRLLLEGEVAPLLKGLTDASIYELINNKKSATKPELQKLQNNSKNPL